MTCECIKPRLPDKNVGIFMATLMGTDGGMLEHPIYRQTHIIFKNHMEDMNSSSACLRAQRNQRLLQYCRGSNASVQTDREFFLF